MTAATCDPCRLAIGLTPYHAPDRNRYDFRLLTAIHEAAHAVCAYHFGSKVLSLHIKAGRPLLGQMQYSGVCAYIPSSKSRTDDRIVKVAGLVGEAVFLGWNDWSEIEAGYFNQTDGANVNPDNVAHAVCRARAILTEKWHLVVTLAEALEHAGELTEWQVQGLIQIELARQWLREKSNRRAGK